MYAMDLVQRGTNSSVLSLLEFQAAMAVVVRPLAWLRKQRRLSLGGRRNLPPLKTPKVTALDVFARCPVVGRLATFQNQLLSM